MAEIRMERTQSSVLPWLLGLALLTLVILGLLLVADDSASGVDDTGRAHEVVNPQEEKEEKDETPRRLQQWASGLSATTAAGPARAA